MSLFPSYEVCNVKAEEVMSTYADIQYENVSEYSPDRYLEYYNSMQEGTGDTRLRTENLILKWSFGLTFIILATCIFVLLQKYKSLKNYKILCCNESTDEIATENIEHNDIDTNDIQNEAICMFRNIDEAMRKNKPYLDINFTRDTMIRMFNTNKNKLNEAIIAGSGMSYSKYICELRLQESIRILESDSNILLNDLAVRCGFNTYSSFYRSFYKRFGMSPADYKHEYKKDGKVISVQ